MPSADVTTINGINASGNIAGIYVDGSGFHGYFLDKKGFATLDPPGSIRTLGFFLNAHDQVVGVYRIRDQTRHGYVWSKGQYTTIDVPGDWRHWVPRPLASTTPGDVVGTYVDQDGDRHAFLMSKGALYNTRRSRRGFHHSPGDQQSGEIAGLYVVGDTSHGFVLSDGEYTTVDVPGADWTEVYSINAKGEIVGAYEDADGVHGFRGTPVH